MANDDTQAIYERLENEPANWYHRFLLYRNMGTDRTLLGAINKERVQNGSKKFNGTPASWLNAFNRYDWKFRAEQYDNKLERDRADRQAVLDAMEQQEIERILTSGYAAIHERIKGLDRMARIIESSFKDEDSGEIKFQFLTPDKVREYRGCLDDIAKELGGRAKKTEITGKGGGAIDIDITTDWGGGALEVTGDE